MHSSPVALPIWAQILDFGFNAYDGFGAVSEADPSAAVGAWEDVCLGDQGPELCRRAGVGADGRLEGERRVQVGELGGGEEDLVGGGGHDWIALDRGGFWVTRSSES